MDQVRQLRRSLVESIGFCELCGLRPRRDVHAVLHCHELLGGGRRDKTLDEPASLLVTCWECNSGPLNCKAAPWVQVERCIECGLYPLARQLAIIKFRCPERYDLERVLELRNPNAPNAVTEEEVDEWVRIDWS